MEDKEKKLLLKDLSSRLVYGVMCKICREGFEDYPPQKLRAVYDSGTCYFDYGIAAIAGSVDSGEVKPYLRKIESMTDEEKKEYLRICESCLDDAGYFDMYDTFESFEWLHEQHFDYRGLIDKGLALEAPNDMYD